MTVAVALLLALPQATPLRLDARVDKDEITLGEPFTLTIAVEHPALDVYALPDALDVAPFALRGSPSVSRVPRGDRAETTFRVPLADYSSLEPEIPAIRLRVDGPDGARELTVPPRKVRLRSLVAAEKAPSAERAHRGPKAPVPVIVRSFLWAWLLGGAAVAAAAILLALRFRRLRAARPAPAAPVATPEEEAMARLLSLKRRAPWDRGLGRPAVFELSEIVRIYLGRRLRFDALDLTTDELIAELRRLRLLGLDLAELMQELHWQDLVKFAKAEPSADDCVRAIDRAASLVDRTRAVLPLGRAS
jgi:hypothetical protein